MKPVQLRMNMSFLHLSRDDFSATWLRELLSFYTKFIRNTYFPNDMTKQTTEAAGGGNRSECPAAEGKGSLLAEGSRQATTAPGSRRNGDQTGPGKDRHVGRAGAPAPEYSHNLTGGEGLAEPCTLTPAGVLPHQNTPGQVNTQLYRPGTPCHVGIMHA